MTTATKSDRIRGFFLGLSCVVIAIVFLYSMLVFRHSQFVHGLFGYAAMTSPDYERPVFPMLTDREVANLGWAHSESRHPASSYIEFPAEKPPGVVRVGTFGDAWTAGSEVAPTHDYPSLLQRRFDDAGYDDVEVINFGVDSYGIHQSYLMWKTLGERYDLDVAILSAFPAHFERDSTFIKNPLVFGGVHARYVLRGGDAELVEVLGDDRIEAGSRYFEIIPALRYLRYDRRPPTFIRAVVPDARSLNSNPLYYKKKMGLKEEMRAIDSILFERWAEGVAHLVITTPNGDFHEELEAMVESAKVHLLESQFVADTASTLYRAPGWNPSALANDSHAEELFSYLTGRANPEFREVRVAAATGSPETSEVPFGPLSRFAQVTVNVGDMPVAGFVASRHSRDAYRFGSDLDFSRSRVWSLLQIPADEVAFVPIGFPLADGTPVSIEFELDGDRIEAPIGSIEAGMDVLGRIVLNAVDASGALAKSEADWSMDLAETEGLMAIRIKADGKARSPRVIVGEQPILVGKRPRLADGADQRHGRLYRFVPIDGKFVSLRAKAGQFPDLARLAGASGSLELVMEDADGVQLRHPTLFDYEVEVREGRPFGKPFSPALSRGAAPDSR